MLSPLCFMPDDPPAAGGDKLLINTDGALIPPPVPLPRSPPLLYRGLTSRWSRLALATSRGEHAIAARSAHAAGRHRTRGGPAARTCSFRTTPAAGPQCRRRRRRNEQTETIRLRDTVARLSMPASDRRSAITEQKAHRYRAGHYSRPVACDSNAPDSSSPESGTTAFSGLRYGFRLASGGRKFGHGTHRNSCRS